MNCGPGELRRCFLEGQLFRVEWYVQGRFHMYEHRASAVSGVMVCFCPTHFVHCHQDIHIAASTYHQAISMVDRFSCKCRYHANPHMYTLLITRRRNKHPHTFTIQLRNRDEEIMAQFHISHICLVDLVTVPAEHHAECEVEFCPSQAAEEVNGCF